MSIFFPISITILLIVQLYLIMQMGKDPKQTKKNEKHQKNLIKKGEKNHEKLEPK